MDAKSNSSEAADSAQPQFVVTKLAAADEFSNTYRCVFEEQKCYVRVFDQLLARGEKLLETLIGHLDALKQIDSPHLAPIINYNLSGNDFYLFYTVPHHCSMKSLFKKGFTNDQALEYIQLISEAFQHVHRQGVILANIKSSTVYIEGGRAVFADPAISWLVASRLHRLQPSIDFCNNQLYAAPELLLNKRATLQSDTYSLGCLFHQIQYGSKSLRNRSLGAVEGLRPLPAEMKQCIKEMMSSEASKRPDSLNLVHLLSSHKAS